MKNSIDNRFIYTTFIHKVYRPVPLPVYIYWQILSICSQYFFLYILLYFFIFFYKKNQSKYKIKINQILLNKTLFQNFQVPQGQHYRNFVWVDYSLLSHYAKKYMGFPLTLPILLFIAYSKVCIAIFGQDHCHI